MPTITVGQTLTGTISTAYALTNYDVALTANTTYTIRMVGAGTSSYTLGDPIIDGIYNSTGSTYISGFNNDGLISGPNGRDAMTTFRPATSGTYRIMVSGDLATTGTYAFSVINSSGGTDTIAATTATTGTVAVGGSVNGTIDSENDVDWYRVALTSGTTYTIRMRGLVSGNGTLPDPVVAGIYDSNGNYLTNTYVDDLDTRDAGVTFVTPYTGNYYIAARGWSTYTGTFALDVAATGTDVPGNLSSTATLPIGSSVTTNMEQPYDHDWYGVTLTAGRTYQFSLSGTGANNTPVMHGIFNSAGIYMGGYAAPVLGPLSASSTSIFTPTVNGTYFIDAFSLYEGSYTLTATQVADDVPFTTSTPASVSVGGSITGDIGGATDIDMHAVNLIGGVTYVIKLQGKQSNKGTLEDPIIAGIYNSSGAVMPNTFSDDNDGNEASVIFRPTTSGTYYIGADGYSGYTGTYTLSVTSIAGDIGQTTATAGTVSLNAPAVVTIDDAADIDWYGVTLTAGNTYGIRLQGAPTSRGSLADPVIIGLYNSAGVLVSDTFVDDARGLLNPVLTFTPSSTDTYYVAADGYDRFTGTAKLAVTIDNIGTTNATAGSFSVGTAAEGTIDAAGDVDRYGVTLEASTTYYVRMRGIDSRSGDLSDPLITGIFYNTSSTAHTVTTISDPADPLSVVVGRDSWLKLTTAAGAAGTYYVVTSGASSTDGAFLLSADKDIPGSQSTTATISPLPGSVTGMIDEPTDTDWYAVTLNTNTSYVIKMLGVNSGNGSLADPYINGIRFSTTPTTIIAGTSGTGVDNAFGRDSVARIIPGTAGTYYINAQSSSSSFGSYTLSISTEVGNTTTTADTTLTVGGSATGMIDDTTDIDYFKITLAANTGYIFKMLGVETGAGTLDDPLIQSIRNSSNTAQTTGFVASSVGLDSYARWVSGTAGDYYIEAQGAGTDTGTFVLIAETEPGNSYASAWTISTTGSVTGNIDDNTDTDYYKFTHDTSTGYLIRMKGAASGSGTLVNPDINEVRASNGTAQTNEVFISTADDDFVRWAPTTAGTADYTIEVAGSGARGTYTLSMEKEAGSGAVSAWTMAVGSSVTAALDDGGDTDWYAVTLTGGYTYRIDVQGADSGNGTLIDPYINGLRTGATATSATTAVASTTVDGGGTGRDARLSFTPGSTNTYYIQVDNGTANTTATGTYKISVTQTNPVPQSMLLEPTALTGVPTDTGDLWM